MSVFYLTVADYLTIAERVLGVPKADLARVVKRGLVESALAAPAASFAGQDQYPDLPAKTAVLMARIARNHALPDGNKRVGWQAGLVFMAWNGINVAVRAKNDAQRNDHVMRAVAAGELDEAELAAWLSDEFPGLSPPK